MNNLKDPGNLPIKNFSGTKGNRYYIIAGEASGDLHGSNLIKEIKKLDADTSFRCWGGDLMQSAGADIVKHYRELAFMGFAEVLMNLRTIFRNLAYCKEDILQYKPDAIILIDYPGFNLRIAEWGKANGFKIIYYISPQVWAWKENRVKKMKRCIDLMLVILPFEKEYYQNKWNWEVEYVGHPLVEVVNEFVAGSWGLEVKSRESGVNAESGVKSRESGVNVESGVKDSGLQATGSGLVALLPGSRKQEILKKLPIMLAVSKEFPSYQFVVAKAPGVEDAFYEAMLQSYSDVTSVSNQTYSLLKRASAALVTSGTATLETALFGVPEVVCYKGSFISYQIAKRIISIKYISLVNLIMNKEVVKELIQQELNAENLLKELSLLLTNPAKKQQLKEDYAALKQLLSQGGHASANAARHIHLFMQEAIS
ncbi:MAG: lipid-A-disaccharide synthase [Chitinophagaceae bacterium]